ncbi:hypothetical protein SAMN04490207_5242 [Pseudomonas gessardii]|nr:hypothetical protein [Pseudomonas gessardii]ONH46317.1 hypothetical protein BLL38_07145 [Pseudomonas gessardii]SDR33557.1 hypothetical protein SAMN04490207_5242 [Pseudomonas gessardii]
MNTQWSLNDLPENLVPFQARPIDTQLIWAGGALEHEADLLTACSYSINSSAPETAAKTFFAERYGGRGIVQNGGGARCGFDGRYQVKGIGANPLVGVGTDRHHSNGALAEDYAVYESIWGEILAELLPYGAVRSLAVLRTEQFVDIDFERNSRRARKALLVREPVIRPAHFERAPYFKPQPHIIDQIYHDHERIGIVLGKLPYMLPQSSEPSPDVGMQGTERICAEGLIELARRQARQMAFCRTRLIMLTTSPSNISIDGRLLDFNGVYCLSPTDDPFDFEFKVKFNNLICEPGMLLQGLLDICLYLGKHLFDRTFSQNLQAHVSQVFNQELNVCSAMQQLSLVGINVTSIKNEAGFYALYRMAMLLARLISFYHARHGYDGGESMRQVLSAIVTSIVSPTPRGALDVPGLSKLDYKLQVQVSSCLAAFREVLSSQAVGIVSGLDQSEQVRTHIDKKYGIRVELQKKHMLQEINSILSSDQLGVDIRLALQQLTARKISCARDFF